MILDLSKLSLKWDKKNIRKWNNLFGVVSISKWVFQLVYLKQPEFSNPGCII
jgi:hypothetical protein